MQADFAVFETQAITVLVLCVDASIIHKRGKGTLQDVLEIVRHESTRQGRHHSIYVTASPAAQFMAQAFGAGIYQHKTWVG